MVSPGSLLEKNARRIPHKNALLCGESEITWEALDRSTTLLAGWFLEQGLAPGDRVAIRWTSDVAAVQLIFALFKAGLVAVTINTRLKPAEILFILNHSQAKMCFSQDSLSPFVQEAGAPCPVLSRLPDTFAAPSSKFALAPVDPDSPALLMYTSGTTARPKGVIHTHRSLFYTGAYAVEALSSTQQDDEIALCVLPLMHMGAFAAALASFHAGGTLALLPRFEAGAVLGAIEKFQCSTLLCMPALWHLILDEQTQRPRRVDSLKSATAAGDAVPVALQQRFQTVFGIPLREAYGMTESVPLTTNPGDAIRPGSMGTCIKGVELRVVDANCDDVTDGEVGEILVRSAANSVGYWNDAEATRLAFENGWLHTGDLASRDSDGYYWFRGRKKEIIIRAGSNISPQEVEEALFHHPAVAEIGVVGQADAVLGEIVVAFVTLRGGCAADAAELRQFAQTRIADYKLPEKFIFRAELPKGPTGKVDRRALKASLPESMSAAN